MKNGKYNIIIRVLLTICWIGIGIGARGQTLKKPPTFILDSDKTTNSSFINNIFLQALSSIKKGPTDTATNNLYYTGKSEEPYMPFEGKIIRRINIEALDFERSFSDTSVRIVSMAARAANAVHVNTRESVIRDNLFIKEGTPVNAYKIADNERFLRTIDFIHDARILLQFIPNNPDSVDLLVVTKDFFNISADGASQGANHIFVNLIDANFQGTGQRIELGGLYDYTRSPNYGFGGLYRVNNMFHSFVSGTAGISTILGNPLTHEEEFREYVNFSRPLVSPLSHWAGALLFSHNEASNKYHTPDSLFYRYKYNVYDGWIAYNLGINKLLVSKKTIRDRSFVSLRYFDYKFGEMPGQIANRFDPIFNNRQAVLGQITLFRQEYFKTQYIYGFGTIEDLPYGYNISVTAGWHRQLNLERPYLGFHALRYLATQRGDFVQLFFRTGGFWHDKEMQDASLLFGATAFSRIIFWNDIKIRHFVSLSYASLERRVTYAPLRIDNLYGLGGFLTDSAYGDRRITLQMETEFYLKCKLLGFQFAPFTHIDLSVLRPENSVYSRAGLYSGLGGGIRTRNENLIFETIEFRFYYYPVTPDNIHGFKIVLNSNIRYRYNSNYISAPDVVQLNMEQ